MALTLTLDDPHCAGSPAAPTLSLDRRGAIIGRSPTVDWTLPDPEMVVSSRHCEVDYRGGAYLLVDTSTNGTLVNDRPVSGPHVLSDGDRIAIGRYRVGVALDQPATATAAPSQSAGWGGWDSHLSTEPVGVDPTGWDRPRPAAEISGRGALSGQWAAPRPVETAPAAEAWSTAGSVPAAWSAPPPADPAQPEPEPAAWGTWSEARTPVEPASGWSSAPAAPSAPAAEDIWGKLAASNVVDWARGGFGASAPPPTPPSNPMVDPLGLDRSHDVTALGAPGALHAPPPPAPAPSRTEPGADFTSGFAAGAGLAAADLPAEDELATGAGRLLRRLVAGMVVMLEARARAKSQMGAQGTSLAFDGNNPLKFARAPEAALLQLLRSPERGFMPAERAVEDAFLDLQVHQVATLKAMQGALRATLDRFSPDAIRGRADKRGRLSRLLPGSRDAALWAAYEREFSGVAKGSDEAFMDVFAKEFRRAYEEAARRSER